MLLVFGDYQIEVPEPLPTNLRGRKGIRNIFYNALPAFHKISLEEALGILIAGWEK